MTLMGINIPMEAIRRQIASGIDILVHLVRLRDGSRKVLEIAEILRYEEEEVKIQTLFKYDYKEKCLYKENELYNKEKWEKAGQDEL